MLSQVLPTFSRITLCSRSSDAVATRSKLPVAAVMPLLLPSKGLLIGGASSPSADPISSGDGRSPLAEIDPRWGGGGGRAVERADVSEAAVWGRLVKPTAARVRLHEPRGG